MELVRLTLHIRGDIHVRLTKEAETRGVTVQELVRAVILPEWIAHAKPVNEVQTDG